MLKHFIAGSIFIFLLLLFLWPAVVHGQHCFSDIRQQALIDAHPEYVKKSAEIEAFTQNWIKKNGQHLKSGATYQIPVVVHIVWYEMVENISDEQILSQIEVLNQDFQALNKDTALVPIAFRSLIADTEISFCLATTDPEGNPSDGITRTQTNYPDVGTAQDESGRFRIFYTDAGGRDVWDPEHYLNIWVARRGYGSGLASFPATVPPEEDGLVIGYLYFGATGTATDNAPYHLGRTVTHEVGHYFNLLHPWGRSLNPSCDMDDEVGDTPRQALTYLRECPQDQPVTCETSDFFFNFMNYTDDACMAMFTLGQKMRMLAALEGPRSGLLNAPNLCDPLNTSTDIIAPLPFKLWSDIQSGLIWIESNNKNGIQLDIQLFNLLGQRFWRQAHWINARKVLGLPSLNPGVYLLHLHWQGESYVHKIIIQ